MAEGASTMQPARLLLLHDRRRDKDDDVMPPI